MRIGERAKRTARSIACVLLSLCASTGCASNEDTWSFAVSREVYPDLAEQFADDDRSEHEEYLSGRRAVPDLFGAIALVFVGIPVIIDVVLLPVTAVHDVVLPLLPERDDDEPEPLRPAPPPPRSSSGTTTLVTR
jgi:hypothetical protein